MKWNSMIRLIVILFLSLAVLGSLPALSINFERVAADPGGNHGGD